MKTSIVDGVECPETIEKVECCSYVETAKHMYYISMKVHRSLIFIKASFHDAENKIISPSEFENDRRSSHM